VQIWPIAWHAAHLTMGCEWVTELQQMRTSASRGAAGSSALRQPSATCAIAHSAPACFRQSVSVAHRSMTGHRLASRNLPPIGLAIRSSPCSAPSYSSLCPARVHCALQAGPCWSLLTAACAHGGLQRPEGRHEGRQSAAA
jgi:hypothetical protein